MTYKISVLHHLIVTCHVDKFQKNQVIYIVITNYVTITYYGENI